MPCQIILLPRDIIDCLLARDLLLSADLGSETGLRIDITPLHSEIRTIAIYALPEIHGVGQRELRQPDVLALLLVQDGTTPECWPRPLPDAVTLHLLDLIAQVLCHLDGLTSHQLMIIADALEHARSGSAVRGRPLNARLPKSARQRRLRRAALEFTTRYAEDLEVFDAKLESYRDRLTASDLEYVIVSLSCWTDPGMQLYVGSQDGGIEPSVKLLAETRTGDLRLAMERANVLADTTLSVLEMYGPHAAPFRTQLSAGDLMKFNGRLVDDPFQIWRDTDLPNPGGLPVTVPPTGIPQAIRHWCEDMQAERWVDIHPLVYAGFGYRELLRIRPFSAANGAMARLILQLLLYRAGCPVLPWSAAFEVSAMQTAEPPDAFCYRRGGVAFWEDLLCRAELAIAVGHMMIETLLPAREDLDGSFSSKMKSPGQKRCGVDDLIRAPLVFGLSGCSRERNREELRALVNNGKLQRVRSPLGMVYSVSTVRRLLRDLSMLSSRGAR